MVRHWRLAWLPLLVALVGSAGAARPAGRATTTDAALGRVGTRRLAIGKVRVREEASPPSPYPKLEGSFIVPNEVARIFAPALRGRAASGGVLAVGTLRGLEDAVHALEGLDAIPDGFRVIQMDIDEGATRFNAANAALLASGSSRASYRDALSVGVEIWPQGHLPGWANQPPVAGPSGGPRAGALVGKALMASKPVDTLGRHLRRYDATPGEGERTIAGSDARFARAQDLARAGRIVGLNGSLVGTRTLRGVGKALRARGERLSVVDLSNAGNWIARDRGNGRGLGDLVANLAALPLSDDAVVLVTREPASYAMKVAYDENLALKWRYAAIPARDFLAALGPGGLAGPGTPDGTRWQKLLDTVAFASPPGPDGLLQPPPGFATVASRR